MAIKAKTLPHVKPSIVSAVADLLASDKSMWTSPVQPDQQSRALKILGFAWGRLSPIIFPIFPKSPDREEIIAAAIETQARALMLLRMLAASKRGVA